MEEAGLVVVVLGVARVVASRDGFGYLINDSGRGVYGVNEGTRRALGNFLIKGRVGT